VDDKLSGSTAITVNFHGNQITVCNAGDSRAVIGHYVPDRSSGDQEEKTEIEPELEPLQDVEVVTGSSTTTKVLDQNATKAFPSGGRMLAIPLSRDQTPYRRDERERVKKEGAAIMSIDQMEGQEDMHENWGDMVLGEDVDVHGDPPRVWMQGKDYPGTAFTRSIGDALAEKIGVSAEPEMLARELTSNDHVLVIASDGIFEFLTNQEVIDMCMACDSALIACDKLVKAAYDKWLLYENRTDDITVIVCFLTVNKPPPVNGEEGTTEDLIELAQSAYGQKPIRNSRMFQTGDKSDSMHIGKEDEPPLEC
jgi:serine/threonine protein phosphatase PrpC